MSRLFRSKHARLAHLVAGKKGVAGEVNDLRKDVGEAFDKLLDEGTDAASQAVWYIDQTNGSDNNDGTEAKPLKTWAELEKRWGSNRMVGHYFVYIPNGLPATDPIHLTRVNAGVGFEVHFIGARTQVAAGTVAAVTALNRATNQHTEITITGFDWAPHVGRLVRVTSGARAGVTAWVEADLTGGAARLSAPQQTVYGTPATTSWSALTQTNVLVGDEIEVVTLAEIAEQPHIDVGQSTTPSGRITFEDFRFTRSNYVVGAACLSSSLRLLRCDVAFIETGGTGWTIFHNSHVRGGGFFGRTDLRGGLYTGAFNWGWSYQPHLIGYDVLVGAAGRFVGGLRTSFMVANVGVSAVSGTLFAFGVAGVAHLTGGVIYGTTANTTGFDLGAGSDLVSDAGTTPTLATGTGANVSLRGVTKLWSELATNYTSTTNGARILYNPA